MGKKGPKTKPEALAFPENAPEDIRRTYPVHRGLTKREYFAIKAMEGRLSRDAHHDPLEIAEESVRDADALIRELNETNPESNP